MSDDDEGRSPKEAVRVRLLEQALEDTLQLYSHELKSAIECAQASICQLIGFYVTLRRRGPKPDY
jgi:hypothetical protein